MRLIDADALESAIDLLDWHSANADGVLISGAKDENEAYVRFGEVEKTIDDAPTVDAVTVVRCKDCRNIQGCKNAQYLGLEGYCSYGERE